MENKSAEPKKVSKLHIVNVNAHLHTPFSFSAFDDIEQALDLAAAQDVKVVGINDFYTQAGYGQWQAGCAARGLYPLFNMEIIGLQADFQQRGVRVNDPNNPGRTYISGKGLACPAHITEPHASRLQQVKEANNLQVVQMCQKLNTHLAACGLPITLDIDHIKATYTKGSLRERHLAKALRHALYTLGQDTPAVVLKYCETLFGGRAMKAPLDRPAAVENEIRSNLLKAGGQAFVPEDPESFLSVEQACALIKAAGGLPTYPFLADDAKGGFTDFEASLEQVAHNLTQMGFLSVEFIPTRNSAACLERYATYLYDNGFLVTFGSEHNTPAMEPLLLHTREGAPLSQNLRQINYQSACVLAAHQDQIQKGTGLGYTQPAQRPAFITLGDQLIYDTH